MDDLARDSLLDPGTSHRILLLALLLSLVYLLLASMLGPMPGIDWVWDSAMGCRRKPQWHMLIPETRILRERLFDWADSREFDIVKKAQTFTQYELEDYYVDVVETQVQEQLGHSLRTKDAIFRESSET